MKDSRKGEALWFEWDGDGYVNVYHSDAIVFYTEEHVDVEHEVVRRALASTIQRDGIVDSLSEAFGLLLSSHTSLLYCGVVSGEAYPVICSEDGTTDDGEVVDEVVSITVVEIAKL